MKNHYLVLSKYFSNTWHQLKTIDWFYLVLFLIGHVIISARLIMVSPATNAIILFLGAVLAILCIYLTVFRKYSPIKGRFNLLIWAFVLFAVQVFISFCVYCAPISDSVYLDNSSLQIALNGAVQFDKGYFVQNPNNIFLLGIYVMIKKAALATGFLDPYYATVLSGVVAGNLSCVLVTKITAKLTSNERLVPFCFTASAIFVGLSAGLYLPYSDSIAILFVNLILYLYVYMPGNKYDYLQWFLIFVISFIGMLIKPTVLIVLIAIVIIQVIKIIKIRQVKAKAFILALLLVISYFGVNRYKYLQADLLLGGAQNLYGSPMATPFTHYLMMGLNEEYLGMYRQEDAMYTASFKTHEEKVHANLTVASERLKNFGFFGYIDFLSKKMANNYSSGTFCFDQTTRSDEGTFFSPVNPVSTILRNYYYSNANIYFYLYQVMWKALLLLTLFSSLFSHANHRDVIHLSIIGISIFTLIFEGSPKYLFIYATFYIICSCLTLNDINEYVKAK